MAEAYKKLSELEEVLSIGDDDYLLLVQAGVSKRVKVSVLLGSIPEPEPELAPILHSLGIDIIDAAGSEYVVATGLYLGGATACELSTDGGNTWSAAIITANSATSVTILTPVLTAGAALLRVTTAGGTSNTLALEAHGKAVKFAGSQSYYGPGSSGAVKTARVRFRIDAMPDKTFRIVAGPNPGNFQTGWLVTTNSTITAVTPAVGQLTVYVGDGSSLAVVAKKFFMPDDIGRTFVLHIVHNGTDTRVYLDGKLLDVPVVKTLASSTSPMLIGGRSDGTFSSSDLAVLDVAEGTTALSPAEVAADAASPVPAYAGQTHRYVASSSIGAAWSDEVGVSHLTRFGSPTLVSPKGKRARYRGVLEVWGDSIAAGRQNGGTLGDGWRRATERSLSSRGISVALRGFTYSGSGTNDYDIWHSATGGEALNTRLATLAANLATSAPADSATVLAYGINDIVALNRTAAQLRANVTTAVGLIATARPGRPIFVFNMLPRSGNTGSQQTEWLDYVTGFEDMISTLHATYPQVVGIDYRSVVTDAADLAQLYDGTHPTPATYAAMASVIAPIVAETMAA